MKNIKVTFYSLDGKETEFSCIFLSEYSLNQFLNKYEVDNNKQGRFYSEVNDEDCFEELPIVKANHKSFVMIYNNIYPNSKIS